MYAICKYASTEVCCIFWKIEYVVYTHCHRKLAHQKILVVSKPNLTSGCVSSRYANDKQYNVYVHYVMLLKVCSLQSLKRVHFRNMSVLTFCRGVLFIKDTTTMPSNLIQYNQLSVRERQNHWDDGSWVAIWQAESSTDNSLSTVKRFRDHWIRERSHVVKLRILSPG